MAVTIPSTGGAHLCDALVCRNAAILLAAKGRNSQWLLGCAPHHLNTVVFGGRRTVATVAAATAA